jgi:predicted GIY-YIG superfamily endonuclease
MKTDVRDAVWSVYVLYSPSSRRTYVGCAHAVMARLVQHNAGATRATRAGRPWTVVLTEEVGSYAAARARGRHSAGGAFSGGKDTTIVVASGSACSVRAPPWASANSFAA